MVIRFIWEIYLHIDNYLGDKIINEEINWLLYSYKWESQLKSYKKNIWKTKSIKILKPKQFAQTSLSIPNVFYTVSPTQSLLHSIYNSDSLHKNWPIDFNKEFCSGKAFFRSFSGANSRQLDHSINPIHAEDQPGVFLLHFGTNDMLNNANDTELANNITNIGLSCKGHGVNKVFILSILV